MLAGEGGAATQDALSRRLSVDRSNAGRAFKRLEQAGYVARRKDDADNRTNLVDITPKGREAAAEVSRLRGEMARSFFGDLTEADAATVVVVLRKTVP
jgi:DNA-binding MarR family transcriptional regulator